MTLQSIGFSVYKENNSFVTSSLHSMSGDEKNIDLFIEDLEKEKKILKIERRGNSFFLLEKADEKAAKFITPKIIFIKPVVMDTDGVETWEIGSWEKKEVSDFISYVKKEVPNFNLIRFTNSALDEVFFPKILPNLTDKQKRAIELAIKEGYYSTPRRTGLRKLAALMKVSLSTYEQHLRVAEEKVIPTAILNTK